MKSLICITGAAGGLGKAFAVECASRGWDLFITDIKEEVLLSLAKGLSSTYGVNVLSYPCNLTDEVSKADLYHYVKEKDLYFKGLINVAGCDYEGLFADRTPEQIRDILRLNIEAALEMTYFILKRRKKGELLRIINVASLAAFYPMPAKAMYAASKRFLLDFSMALREEIRALGGTVTALCPAGMPTNASCIRAIEAQGFAGRITTKNVGYVAARTIDHALKGDAVYIPGILNQVLRALAGIVPSVITARIVGNRWNEVRRKHSGNILASANKF